MLFKHGGAHGGYVLFLQDGRLHFVYNFIGEEEQTLSSPDPVPAGQPHARCRATRAPEPSRAATRRSATPTLYIDGAEVATFAGVRAHPGTFGLAGASLSVGRNTGSPVSRRYQAPFAFTGGTIAQVNVDVSGTPYVDLERDFARAFAKD